MKHHMYEIRVLIATFLLFRCKPLAESVLEHHLRATEDVCVPGTRHVMYDGRARVGECV